MLATTLRAEISFTSGPMQISLIELYTSEGCSSCPPAEKWLGELRHEKGLWREFVPVAFHVDYWDRLGWRDPLANKAFTAREHSYASLWRASSVYTPCFVRNGTEWRPRSENPGSDPRKSDAGSLTLTWDAGKNMCRIDYGAGSRDETLHGFDASVALLGGGIVSNVSKGENAGRLLRHEFVALQLETVPLERNESGTWSATVVLPPRTDIKTARLALAGWVTPRGQLAPLQAAGGWFEENR